jgi:hypothetical protein
MGDRLGAEGGRIVRDPDDDGAAIGHGVVDAIRNADAARVRAEIVVIDWPRLARPPRAGILEEPDELAFLRIDTDDGPALALKPLPQVGDVLKQKQRLQALFFPEGITFDGTAFNRTNLTGYAFSYLERSEARKCEMVSPEGIEPSTNRLRGPSRLAHGRFCSGKPRIATQRWSCWGSAWGSDSLWLPGRVVGGSEALS